MPDNPTNPSNQPPTLADMSIDLSDFQLMDIGLEEKRRLPKPLADRADLALLSDEMDVDFAALRAYLLK